MLTRLASSRSHAFKLLSPKSLDRVLKQQVTGVQLLLPSEACGSCAEAPNISSSLSKMPKPHIRKEMRFKLLEISSCWNESQNLRDGS